MQSRTLAQLAAHVSGRIVGDPEVLIDSVASLETARPGQIAFFSNQRYAALLETTQASAVVVAQPLPCRAALLITEDPYYAFAQIMVLLYGHRRHAPVGHANQAYIAASAHIGADCHIHPFVSIADRAHIGDRCILYPGVFVGPEVYLGCDCLLYPNVVIYERCTLGDRVIIHANSTVGEDGFGFATHQGIHHKIPQVARVVVEDDVEIGSGCAIERGTLDDTVIGRGSKVGDTVTIGHGAKVGPHCLLVPQVGIAGSATLGHHCVLGGQVGVVGHIHIGNQVRIGAQAGVISDVPDGAEIVGSPAIEAHKARRSYALIEYLPAMRQTLKDLARRVRKMEQASPKP